MIDDASERVFNRLNHPKTGGYNGGDPDFWLSYNCCKGWPAMGRHCPGDDGWGDFDFDGMETSPVTFSETPRTRWVALIHQPGWCTTLAEHRSLFHNVWTHLTALNMLQYVCCEDSSPILSAWYSTVVSHCSDWNHRQCAGWMEQLPAAERKHNQRDGQRQIDG